MIEASGATIAGRLVCDSDLPLRSGVDVAAELRGRYLLRYALYDQVDEFAEGSHARHCVTPTPLGTADLVAFLALPSPTGLRTHVVALDPQAIPAIKGPRWVRGGPGIEYVLPHGFPKAALAVVPWPLEVT